MSVLVMGVPPLSVSFHLTVLVVRVVFVWAVVLQTPIAVRCSNVILATCGVAVPLVRTQRC